MEGLDGINPYLEFSRPCTNPMGDPDAPRTLEEGAGMELFSQRKGLKSIKNSIQTDSVDQALRSRLWNVVHTKLLGRIRMAITTPSAISPALGEFIHRLWDAYFKLPVDTIPLMGMEVYTRIKSYFFDCEWFEIYDFLEFIVSNYPYPRGSKTFTKDVNLVLEKEVSAYRFVGDRVAQITSETELQEVEESLARKDPSSLHLHRALELLSDRESPDYRNSIKESISAVEAVCNLIVGDAKATLGQALKTLKNQDKVIIHPALVEGFRKLYGYTSDADGIRHALLDESKLGYDEAKFMLVSCSAFVNYLLSKTSEAGIQHQRY